MNPYAPPSTTVPSSAPAAPVPPVAPAAEQPANPYAAPAAPVPPAAPAAAQPTNPYAAPANPYAATPANPYAAPGAAPTASGTPAYAATPAYATGAPAGPSRFNVMGLVSLILGGVAFLFGITVGWIPYVGFFFVLLALVGVVLGIVGLLAKNKGKGLAIAGTIVSGVSLLLTAAISVVMLLFITSYSNTVDDFTWDDDPVITDPEEDYGTGSDDDPDALGGINNPAAVGDTVTFSDYSGADQWQVVVGAPNLDATADVLAADEYNEQPQPGNVYIVVPMTVTYLGEDTDLPYMLYTELLTSGMDVYDVSYADYPGNIYDADELATGETADVNLVFEVPADATPGSVLRISSIWGNEIHVLIS
ncbi:hypothetical protein H4J02_10720 [Protaetiibacter sp. SSC-01]|uniref:hypothetical protein n=1 Tax=Protaetiibacter sp. SSC-01 TaxID=2759943 RepID=UPI0016571573|nr:hypothetical protein [Protaetiibacter sp. SSC-01]QNO36932.1 hypothetical protein H4J02_10720 [Protaetiibacter sp. SSC-01]